MPRFVRRATLSLLLALLAFGLGPLPEGRAVAPPAAVAEYPGPDAAGDPAAYAREHAKALDPVYDTAIPGVAEGDLMSLYYDQNVDRLALRAGLKDLSMPVAGVVGGAAAVGGGAAGGGGRARPAMALDAVRSGRVAVLFLLDYAMGGTILVPGVRSAAAPFGWECAVLVEGAGGAARATYFDATRGALDAGLLRGVRVTPEADMVEVSLALPLGFREAAARAAGIAVEEFDREAPRLAAADATPVRLAVLTIVDGAIQDRIETTAQSSVTAKNVAFVQHGNQGLTYTTVFRGERGENAANDGDVNNPDDGFDEILGIHQYYSIPGCFHLAATLQTAAEWHDPAFNDWLAAGDSAGWADLVTSAYAQHIMPFVQNAMNDWAVNIEKDMTDWRYTTTATVAWVPERVWCESPDNDGNGTNAGCSVVDPTLTDNWLPHGVQAVILDDYVHTGYYDTWSDDRHVYVLGNGLKVVPIDNTFVGDVNWNWGNAWNTITSLSSDELLVYGNDWEIAAEVSQGASNPNGLNNYCQVIRQCSLNSGTVAVWQISDAINQASFISGTSPIVLQNGTYGLLGGFGGYGGSCNSWYTDWAAYNNPQHQWDQHAPRWNYGQVWNNTYTKIIGVPSNNLSELAWYVMMTNLHETGWHDGSEISGWIYRYSNHIHSANPYAEAARWAAGLYGSTTGAYLDDIDMDGQTEAVIHNDRVYAVFEPIGGRAAWVFAKGTGYNCSVVGNDNVYWADTEGDYNETNHVACFSDVSVAGLDREHDLYSFQVLQATGDTVSLALVHPNVTKTVKLVLGNKYLDVVWDANGQEVYVKNGFTPDLLDMIWSAGRYRVWAPAPSAGRYFGQRNPNTGATAAIVVGSAGAAHNAQISATLLEGDEFKGTGKFEAYLFAGSTAAPAGDGSIAELDALSTQLVDVLKPEAVSAVYYPTPNKLSITFDEKVRYNEVVVTKIKVDDDNGGPADVTLSAGCTVLNTANSARIDIQLDAATANAIEALNTGTLELMMDAGAVKDVAGNANALLDQTGNVAILYTPPTLITIDGYFDPSEWTAPRRIVSDFWDSGWNGSAPDDTNEINAIYMTWDSTNLYLGINGRVKGNSWLLYLDTDPGGPNGSADLDSIDAWERGAQFTGGMKPDFEYGAYQHQGAFDSQGLWKILTSTTTQNVSSSCLFAFDPTHVYGNGGGSEMAIPWDVLYGLGPGTVPPGARISVVASLCWDPEPNGVLGGDVAPNNVSATLPTVDNKRTFAVDGNNDGRPDSPPAGTGVEDDLPAGPRAARTAITSVAPNPFNPVTKITYAVRDRGRGAEATRLAIYDTSGREVAVIVDGPVRPGEHEVAWRAVGRGGRALPSGVYLARLFAAGEEATRKVVLLK